MVNNAEFFTFENIQTILDYHNASEVHGLLCGILCVDSALSSEVWLRCIVDEMPKDTSLSQNSRDLLLELQNVTLSQLRSDDFNFHLLLPSDQISIRQRTVALGCWCQGFLTGLGLGGMQKSWILAPEVQEFLKDLLHIAQVGFDAQSSAEEDERAYSEIVEYVRMGVLMIEQELRSQSNRLRFH